MVDEAVGVWHDEARADLEGGGYVLGGGHGQLPPHPPTLPLLPLQLVLAHL